MAVAAHGTVGFRALGTTAVICTADADGLAAARAEVDRELAGIDLACSRFRDDSELVAVNAAGGRRLPVSATLAEALDIALRAAEATGGAVDPTVGRSLRLLGYDRTFAEVAGRPGREFRPRFAAVAGWRLVELDHERRTVRVPAGVELDLGATAKALAADRAAAAAAAAAGCGVLVSLGGDIAVAGEPPAGGWPVGVADDHAADPDTVETTLLLESGGLATSSTTVRRWETLAGELHHIVDPATGRIPESPWRTVSALAGSCVEANVATTASIVLGPAAPGWLADAGTAARLVRRDGSVLLVGAWPRDAA